MSMINNRFDEQQYLGRGHILNTRDKGEYCEADHDIKTWPGWSGSPLLHAIDSSGERYRLIGIHVHGKEDRNIASLFTRRLIAEFLILKQGAPPSKDLWRQSWP